LKEQLSHYALRSSSKKTFEKPNDRIIQMNRSQPYLEPVSAGLVLEHETNQTEEMAQLRSKVSDLEYENYLLRVDLERVREEIQEQVRSIGINAVF
jgi:hypothetical protein